MDFHTAYHFLITQIQTNQFFSGAALGGLILGVFHYTTKAVPARISALFHAQCMVKVNISSTDPIYDAIQVWMAKSGIFKKSIRLSLFTEYNKFEDDYDLDQEEYQNKLPELHYALAPGNHIFWFNRRLIWLYKERSNTNNITNMSKFVPEFMTFRTIGRSRKTIEKLLNEVMILATKTKQDKIAIHFPYSHGDGWRSSSYRQKRSMDTIVLSSETKEQLIRHIELFKNSANWYYSKGIPYRTGFLFYGPPGTGKSSTITALASYFNMNLCVLNLSSESINDDKLLGLVNTTPPNSMLVMEDIDSAFANRDESVEEKQEKGGKDKNTLTFSGLLNSLDGVAAQEGNIVIMTTNYRERLDKALIRPGRIDKNVYFGLATREQLKEAFLGFFPRSIGHAEKFAESLDVDKYSLASVQNHLLRYRDSADSAVENITQLQ